MQDQLRIYTIKPGEMDAWVDEWRRLIGPLRRKHGFEVLNAWISNDGERFIWILRYGGPRSWEEADAAYYASPERTAMQPDPARHLARTESSLIRPVTT